MTLPNNGSDGRNDTHNGGPFTATHIRELIRLALASNSAITKVESVGSIHMDRLNLDVHDHDGLTWRVYVMSDPRP